MFSIREVRIFNKIKEISYALYNKNPLNFHTSFIIHKGRIISIGVNNKKTHPGNLFNPKINRRGDDISPIKGTCSEFNAIIKLKNTTNFPTNKCILINARIDRNKLFNLARPCNSCQSLLRYFEFKHIFYTGEDGTFEEY